MRKKTQEKTPCSKSSSYTPLKAPSESYTKQIALVAEKIEVKGKHNPSKPPQASHMSHNKNKPAHVSESIRQDRLHAAMLLNWRYEQAQAGKKQNDQHRRVG